MLTLHRVEGVEPTIENIRMGRYALARPMYMYVKLNHLGVVEHLGSFVAEFLSDNALGRNGYLLELGLIPPDDYSNISKARGMLLESRGAPTG